MEIRYRVDGGCSIYQTVPDSYRAAIVSRIKIMSNLDITERRLPQDGKIKFKRSNNDEIELRVATLPTAGNLEDVVLRILEKGEMMHLEEMALSPYNYQNLIKLLEKPYGMILCVGPTGSGKTTTLHSGIHSINTPEKDLDDRRPHRNHPVRDSPGPGEPQDRPRLRPGPEGLFARRPRRDHGGRNARLRDGEDRRRRFAHGAPRVLDPAHQQRPGDDRPSAGHGASTP